MSVTLTSYEIYIKSLALSGNSDIVQVKLITTFFCN